MDYGLALPSTGYASSREGIEAACEAAIRHGFRDVWGTDHLLVDASAADDYGRTFEIVSTMAWIAGRFSTLRIGTSVIVVPMRNAVVLAKELATIDELSGGRLIVGLGVGWSEPEFRNVGVEDRFHVRGAYLEEAIELFRHLWSGSREPFHGRFHEFDDFVFGPLPAQGGATPIWIGGRNERALQRAGRVADGYHATTSGPATIAERVPLIRAAAEAAGRPMPALSARIRIQIDGPATPKVYSFHGSPVEIAGEIRAFADVGVGHIALAFPEKDPEGITRAVERFATEVLPLV
jgi:probable F420-dependent oxidoreductase